MRGKPGGNDRRITSGIIHVLKSRCGWIDASSVHGPYKTLKNRILRWAAKGILGLSVQAVSLRCCVLKLTEDARADSFG
jgi:transposase